MTIPSGLGSQLGFAAETYTNEVQTISGTPSATFGLAFEGYSGAATLPTNASAAAIQAYLEAFPNIGTGNVSCTGGALPTSVSVTFSGGPVATRNVTQLSVVGSVTGLTFGTTTAGKGYGDAVTVTRFLPMLGEDVKLDVVDYQSEGMYPGQTVEDSRLLSQTRRRVSGTIRTPFLTNGMGILLQALTGSTAITTPTNGVLTRLHTYTVASTSGKSLTCQVNRPDAYSQDNAFTWNGMKLDELKMSLATDGGVECEWSVVAKDETTATALATASYASGAAQFNAGDTITVTINGVTAYLRDFTFTFTNNLAKERENLGSDTIDEPLNAAFRSIMLEAQAEFRNDTGTYGYYTDGTIVPVTFTIRGDLIESVTPDYHESIVVTLPACRVRSDGPNVGGPDMLTQGLSIKALDNGTDDPITIEWYTTDTTE